jgi:ubiquinol-cytochrome c reductase cytochrome b subunit
MVNAVGSRTNKHWQKKWIAVKEQCIITPVQHSLIIGSLLGDGTMRVGSGAVNANFKIEQGIAQKAYVFWKYEILKPLVFTEPKVSYRNGINGKYEKSWWFRTVRHPLLTDIYKSFYTEKIRVGKKVVPLDIENYLDPLAIAVWIMDDGSYSKGKIDISTYSFTLEEINLLQNVFKKVFGVISKYYRDRNKGYRMYFNKTETKKLISIIYPYIIPEMRYKIGLC